WKDRIYRIWSTDWFSDPARASNKLLEFVKMCAALSEHQTFEIEASVEDGAVDHERSEAEEAPESPSVSEGEPFESRDVFIEVGDAVTFTSPDAPNEKLRVVITAGPSDPRTNLINEETPLAKALLGLTAGELAELNVSGQPERTFKILRIN